MKITSSWFLSALALVAQFVPSLAGGICYQSETCTGATKTFKSGTVPTSKFACLCAKGKCWVEHVTPGPGEPPATKEGEDGQILELGNRATIFKRKKMSCKLQLDTSFPIKKIRIQQEVFTIRQPSAVTGVRGRRLLHAAPHEEFVHVGMHPEERRLSIFGELLSTTEVPFLCDGEMCGEPHIKQLSGGYYDYHGECDLVFTRSPSFGGDVGLEIHARTKIRYDYSYIESAAIRIGSDILEVGSWGEYFLNGVNGAALPANVSGYPLIHVQENKKKHYFAVDVEDELVIQVQTMKDIVSVSILPKEGDFGPKMQAWFGNSTGLLGSIENDQMVGRDGVTAFEDPNEMGQEWQVRDGDPKLFNEQARAPQYPDGCRLPSLAAKDKRRRLGVSMAKAKAEEACSHASSGKKHLCVSDVMATGDLDFADIY